MFRNSFSLQTLWSFSLWFLLYTVYLTVHFFNLFLTITEPNYHLHLGNVLDRLKRELFTSFIISLLETYSLVSLPQVLHSFKLDQNHFSRDKNNITSHIFSFKQFSGSPKVKVKHFCLAYTILCNLALACFLICFLLPMAFARPSPGHTPFYFDIFSHTDALAPFSLEYGQSLLLI